MPVGNPGARDDVSGRFAPNSADVQNWSSGSQISQGDAAVMLNVGVRSVSDAAKVQEHGTDGLIRAVDIGAIAVSVADPLSEDGRGDPGRGRLGRLSAKFAGG
jgi:hypothetical protein